MSSPDPLAWRREGLVVTVAPGRDAWASHAQSPVILPISDRLWRIYFSVRDADNRARMAAVDVDPSAGMKVVDEHLEPMLAPATAGAFDHEGFGPGAVVVEEGRVWLYYSGVSVRRDVRFQYAIGLAVSEDGGLSFRRAAQGPVIATGPRDPYFSSTPAVLRTAAGWRMWYTGGTGWREVDGVLDPFYEIRTAASQDGLTWTGSSTAVPTQEPWIALTRPSPLAIAGGVRLWFCWRGRGYRDPAFSGEGYRLVWIDLDTNGIAVGQPTEVRFENPPASHEFDATAQAYPCIVPYGNDLIMVYNGDDFGARGFGWARLRGGAGPAGTGAS